MGQISGNISTRSNRLKDRLAQIDFLEGRMGLLEPKDRVWLELHFCHNVSYLQIARLGVQQVNRLLTSC